MRTDARTKGSAVKRRRPISSEDRLYNLARSVSKACDSFFLRRGMKLERPSPWSKRKIDWLPE
jgi:hypothetical protein